MTPTLDTSRSLESEGAEIHCSCCRRQAIVVRGECHILSLLAQEQHRGEVQGIEAAHRRSLGGTRILWRALLGGEIDAYPEYTGTIAQELVRDMPPGAGIVAVGRDFIPFAP